MLGWGGDVKHRWITTVAKDERDDSWLDETGESAHAVAPLRV